jgi:protein disulfide-isomerase-like protein
MRLKIWLSFLCQALLFIWNCEGNVVQITSLNFKENLQPEHDLVIAFFAPWCKHCKQLEPILEHLGSVAPSNVIIAHCDATVERALASRFQVKGYPSIFHINKAGEVRKYDGQRSFEELSDYIEGGWKSQVKLSFWSSPFGPFGQLKGWLIQLTSFGSQAQSSLMEGGMSALMAGSIVVGAVITAAVGFILFLVSLDNDTDTHID